jgi:hypothetical protein
LCHSFYKKKPLQMYFCKGFLRENTEGYSIMLYVRGVKRQLNLPTTFNHEKNRTHRHRRPRHQSE